MSHGGFLKRNPDSQLPQELYRVHLVDHLIASTYELIAAPSLAKDTCGPGPPTKKSNRGQWKGQQHDKMRSIFPHKHRQLWSWSEIRPSAGNMQNTEVHKIDETNLINNVLGLTNNIVICLLTCRGPGISLTARYSLRWNKSTTITWVGICCAHGWLTYVNVKHG